jgi:hypothetical protein
MHFVAVAEAVGQPDFRDPAHVDRLNKTAIPSGTRCAWLTVNDNRNAGDSIASQ